MARRRRSQKIQPAELTLNYTLSGDETASTGYIDLAQSLSILNRKSFRQGYEYTVAGFELISTVDCTVTVHRLGRQWTIFNAWSKAYHMWKRQQDETMESAGLMDTAARYRDFKVYYDEFMSGSTLTTAVAFDDGNLRPQNVLPLSAAQLIDPDVEYEWDYSDVVLPNFVGTTPEEVKLHMLGQDDLGPTPQRGIVKAYAESRSRPHQDDPNIVDVPVGGLFGQMFDVGNDDAEIVESIQDENNNAPYLNSQNTAFEFYPGGGSTTTGANGETLHTTLSTQATGRLISSYGAPCQAPLGLLKVANTLSEGETAILRIVLAPGPYKGVMAMPLQDVN